MDDETLKYLWGLREINKTLITGLESAILVMDKWDELAPERRQSIIESLQHLISQSNKAYETEPAKH
ncbi:MAG: hypothetical protein JSV50_07545 [Desulfobacteraceae bacterium]|nr:MAG: hypothetical protein JSV50_07545 [Desulfobacteraceae bacterium]